MNTTKTNILPAACSKMGQLYSLTFLLCMLLFSFSPSQAADEITKKTSPLVLQP